MCSMILLSMLIFELHINNARTFSVRIFKLIKTASHTFAVISLNIINSYNTQPTVFEFPLTFLNLA